MIVITGAAGFIGSALTCYFNACGRSDLLLVDELGTGEKFRNLSGLRFADYLEKQDFLHHIESDAPLPSIEAICHLGACSSTTEGDASFLMRNNFAYSRSVAAWCLRRSIRFVYASSAATYGDGSQGYADDLATLSRLRPLNKYAFSKHAFDLWSLESGALDQIAGLKYFNVYGPNEYHKGEMSSMVLKAFVQLRTTGKVRLFRSYRPEFAHGQQRRDFLYVKDAVAMTAWVLDRKQVSGVFNLGSGRASTWNDLARAVSAAMNVSGEIEYIEMPESIRSAYQYSTCADITRLRQAGCPIQPRPLEAGVRDYVTNYLQPGRHLRPDDSFKQ